MADKVPNEVVAGGGGANPEGGGSAAGGLAARRVVLTIAGFDPSGGAGVTADLKTIAAYRAYGVACITALTVQSTQGVRRTEPVAAELVRDTLACLVEDVELSAIKIGMLGTAGVVLVVSGFLRGLGRTVPVVLDPVLRSSSGRQLLDAAGLAAMRGELLGLVDWVTPNTDELGALTGRVEGGGLPREQIAQSAAELQQEVERQTGGQLNVVVTGGDLEPPDDYLLTATGARLWLAGERVETTSTHGTGCAFSSALACELALGNGPVMAVRAAKEYVAGAMRAAYPVGKGRGPMDHFWRG